MFKKGLQLSYWTFNHQIKVSNCGDISQIEGQTQPERVGKL